MSINVNVQGIPAAQAILQAVPAMTPDAVKATLQQIEEEAVAIMKSKIRASIRTTDKSFGGLEASVKSVLIINSTSGINLPYSGFSVPGDSLGVLEVGSGLAYAGLAASNIKQTTFNRVVYLNPPGKFRYMGVRPAIPKHPFLEETQEELIPMFLNRFGTNLIRISSDIQTKADSFELAGLASVRFQRSQTFEEGVGE